MRQGTFLGRKARYGYRIIWKADRRGKSKPPLETVPVEAEVVRVVFVMRDNGTIEADIATWLTKNKIPPPVGSRWTKTTVGRILDDSTYCGIYTMNRKDPEKRKRFFHVIPAIVPMDLFYRVRGKRDAA